MGLVDVRSLLTPILEPLYQWAVVAYCDLLWFIPILVVYALDRDSRNSLNMGVMFFGERASAAQIGITHLEEVSDV